MKEKSNMRILNWLIEILVMGIYLIGLLGFIFIPRTLPFFIGLGVTVLAATVTNIILYIIERICGQALFFFKGVTVVHHIVYWILGYVALYIVQCILT